MARSKLSINARILTWARERSGYDIEKAADRLEIKPEQLRRLESGELKPTPAQTRKAGKLYRISPAVFFLSETPTERFAPPADFRTLPSGQEGGSFSLELRREIDRVRSQQRILEEIDRFEGTDPLPVDLPSIAGLSTEQAGHTVRSWLEPILPASIANEVARPVALEDYIEAIERRGVFVTQVSGIPISEMRGFCLPHPYYPMIVLNGKDYPAPRAFTLFHELIHLLLGNECICNDPFASGGQEAYCNSIAAAALMPREKINSHPVVTAAVPGHVWSLAELRLIAIDFAVSREAILRRLVTLNRATQAQYQHLRHEFQEEYAGYATGAAGGGPDHDAMILRNLGGRYVARVLRARNSGLITDAEVGDYIFAKIRWAEGLADRLGIPYDA